ncbi:DNA replication protein [Scopulibacillus darangshiensis]|uniref:DNA replication protein n=1 Tax=Scopulibacillus darangshiensis TaxID=442528 RepID=A0A4V2SNK8_9BACL|nr:DnaD domain-containing protein [Scopulibacillus darangshiensis]TCP31606.1 DNA replication protein [Scopulibacillus darangshiensis]
MEKKLLTDLLVNSNVMIPSLLLDNYYSLGLNERECMLLIHVHAFISHGNYFPTPNELSERMSCTPAECAETLRYLIQKGYLAMDQSKDNNIYSEAYTLLPLWEKLVSHHYQNEVSNESHEQETALYTIFENEFGRPLSPIECETLTMWIDQDQHSSELIKAALRESVISGKLNFRYIDRILFDWKKNSVKTLEQAKAHGEKIRQRFNQKPSQQERKKKPAITFPMYNWLEK